MTTSPQWTARGEIRGEQYLLFWDDACGPYTEGAALDMLIEEMQALPQPTEVALSPTGPSVTFSIDDPVAVLGLLMSRTQLLILDPPQAIVPGCGCGPGEECGMVF